MHQRINLLLTLRSVSLISSYISKDMLYFPETSPALPVTSVIGAVKYKLH